MMKQENELFADVQLCGDTASTGSGVVETDIIDLQVTKAAKCDKALVGGRICYTGTIINNSDVDFITGEQGPVTIRDPLASNVEYIAGTFEYTIGSGQPVQDEPDIDGNNEMTYELEIPAGETVIVEFCVKVLSVPA